MWFRDGAGWMQLENPVEIWSASRPEGVRPLLEALEEARRKNLFCGGFLTYEAASGLDAALETHPQGSLPAAWFALFQSCTRLERLPEPDEGKRAAWKAGLDLKGYTEKTREIREWIASGDTYQVNFTFPMRAQVEQNPYSLFYSMNQPVPAPHAAYIETAGWAVCSASPELFFDKTGEEITMRPMKGTRPRGLWPAADEAMATELQASSKDRAENLMIVDMVRNDLGRIARPGTVEAQQLFEIERYPTVIQMTSTVTAQSSASMSDMLAALFPCASVTGAPKVRTMQLIRELEDGPRGVYTGSIGWISPEGDARFNVAIRTAVVDRLTGEGVYGVGSGIVWDSNAGQEYAECADKARALTGRLPSFDLLETLLWEPEKGFFLLDRHLARLSASAAFFHFALDDRLVRQRLEEAVASGEGPARVRLTLTPSGAPTVEARDLGLPDKPVPWRVALAPDPVDASFPLLYHKTTRRAHYTAALKACPGADEVILWNERGECTETCNGNLVARFGDQLLTPPVACGLLAGTFRDELLARGEIEEGVVRVEELVRADELFHINSVRRWVRLEWLDGRPA